MSKVHSYDLIGMFLLGLLGSGHCVGMCGPIALALSSGQRNERWWGSLVLYNTGRALTYTAVGAVCGALGQSAGLVGSVLKLQLGLTAIAGLLLGFFGLTRLGLVGEPKWMLAGAGVPLPGTSALLRKVVRHQGGPWALVLGLLLGFLPCGLTMAAFVRALSAQRALDGAQLVGAFALGTLPAMVAVSALGARLSLGHRRFAERIAGLLLIGMAAQHLSKVVGVWLG